MRISEPSPSKICWPRYAYK